MAEADEDNNTFQAAFLTVSNHAPSAADDTAATDEDTSVTFQVLANDSDPDGDALTVSAVAQSTHGTVTVNGDGSLTYTPNTNFNGQDRWTYTVTDGTASVTAHVTVTINPVNDPPVADAGADRSAIFNDLLTLDGQGSSDPDGDVLTYNWSFTSRPAGRQQSGL